MTLPKLYRIFFIACTALCANLALAQAYPTRPIRILAGEPGSAPDVSARVIAQAISGPLGQQVYIENHPSVMTGDLAFHSAPDGYTLVQNGSAHWLSGFTRKISWDPVKDFAPITITDRSPAVLVVQPDFQAKNVGEVIAMAKAKPGTLNYAIASPGGPPHLAGALFRQMTEVNIVPVPYKGGGPAVVGLLGGQVQMMFAPASAASTYIKAGRLRALAVTTAKRFVLLPDVPTVAESGVPGFEVAANFGLLAPGGTPPAIVQRLNAEVVAALKRPEVRQNFLAAGVEPIGSTPEEFVAVIKAEMATAGKVMKKVND
ncbi:MAG TPA: tripartite tricarboxylate transporter substrate-binding protein [Burkholderiales bacterium]|jgi:tripartite-type tricarboxylate transporter receptor subunit TctC|nr:tripartite tricarboxylate transporter substrate-binding protein [Burkholderiales bacterium]